MTGGNENSLHLSVDLIVVVGPKWTPAKHQIWLN